MHEKYQIGWREWLSLPLLGVTDIKAKIDTGARTSCLHAFDIEEFKKGRHSYVRFKIHPNQKDSKYTINAQARMIDKRRIRDSGGRVTVRPVILTKVICGDLEWEIELTLISRDAMGFRMLLGRQGVRGHFVVNPSRSYLCEKKGQTI